jgi:uncharacterized membrane protein
LSWVFLSLLSSVIFALVSIIDKLLISYYMPGFRSFGAWVGLVTFTVSIALIFIMPASRDIAAVLAMIALGSGFLWGLGLAFLFFGMRSQDVSRAISVYSIHPIFVALLASVFLGESLSVLQWGAVAITVTGVIIGSSQSKITTRRFDLNQSTVLILFAAILIASAQLVSKHALGGTSLWSFYPYWYLGLSTPFLALLNPSTMREIRMSLMRPSSMVLMVGGEAFLGSLAAWITLAAIQAGPVSLVTAIIGTRPVFVFLIGVFLSTPQVKLLDEQTQRNVLLRKTFSILLIVTGVAIISTGSAI